jgi:hypothetical protein
MEDRTIIPLYLNGDMINNLYNIAVQKFIKEKSVEIKKQTIVTLKTPFSEFSYELCGRYIQGEITVQTVEEVVNEKTEENVSAVITVFNKLEDILNNQNLIKTVDGSDPHGSLAENDFVEFDTVLNENPIITSAKGAIRLLEASKFNSTDNDNILKPLKDGLEEFQTSKCLRYISEPICSAGTKAVVPIESKNLLINTDYLVNGNMHIIGKVLKTTREDRNSVNIMSGTFFDYLDFKEFDSQLRKTNSSAPRLQIIENPDSHNEYPLIEILPIAIFI